MGVRALLMAIGLALLGAGCQPPQSYYALGAAAVAGTTVLAGMPGNEIEQVYYLGVYDPQDQVPPTMYRVTVRGQASGISKTRFASGWVRADLIDSLNTDLKFDKDTGGLTVPAAAAGGPASPFGGTSTSVASSRRLVLFGPEGFREAPRNHRLVIVMGASPDKFFEAVDSALGEYAKATVQQVDSASRDRILREMADLQREQDRVRDVVTDIDAAKGGS